jgi:sec-independent protein translocase protein TatA
MMGLDNPIHLAFLLIILLLVFGAKRLPEMGQSLGSGLRGFKDAIGGESTHSPLAAVAPDPPRAAAPVQGVVGDDAPVAAVATPAREDHAA